MEEKESLWGKVKKKLTKKVKITILCIVLTVCICAGIYYAAQAVVDSMVNQVTTAASNAFQLLFGDKDNKEIELYNVDTNIGVDGCKLRPKTGVYPGTSGSSGSGTSTGSFPSGVKTIQQLLDEEKAAGLITDSTAGVSNRGKTKSMMGWQTLGGLSHSSHTSSSAVINYGKSGAPQHRFVISLKQGTKDVNADIPKTITKGEITWFDELGFGKVEGRYTVAIKQDLGLYIWGKQTQIGDYIDVYLDSGTVINCVVADVKARENKSNIVHQDGSIIEFVTNVHKFYGCCNGTGKNVAPVSVKPEFNQPILGIVKVGSYYDNPECQEGAIGGGTTPSTTTPSTTTETLPDGTEIPEGYAFLDSNGQPCTPDGSSPTGPTTAVTAVPGRRTLTNLFATARLPLGISVYDQTKMAGAQHIGVRDSWKVMFDACKAKDIAWVWQTMSISTVGISSDSPTNYVLDCSKYMAWLWYNVTHTDASETIGKSYGATTAGIVSLYTSNGFKNIGVYGSGVSENDLKPGDVLNKYTIGGTHHVVMVVGRAKDGGIVIIHCSPNGVKLGGIGPNASKVAESYMKTYVPEFPSNKVKSSGFNASKVTLNSDYINGYTVLRQDGLLEDPDGIYNMNAEQILDIMFGVNALGEALPGGSGSTGKKVFIDPGHGPGTFNDAQMTAAGYSKNSSGAWGEWRHYDSTGKVGTNCNNCGKDANHACWYPFANAVRPEHLEPVLTMNIANELVPILQSRGYEVAVSRNSSEHPSIGKRAKDAYDFGAHIQVCIHTNAGGGSGIAYCSPAGGGYGSNSYKTSDWQSKSIDLNKKILDKVKAKTTLGLYNGGIINNYGYLILYEKASCPTAYLELGFHDNESDLAKIKAETKQIAEGIADGIDEYFK